ncbi:MAG TPA: c-type cytochrome domain-containing protein [Steroidobacteraceae bacterium]|nr:c-type cytochrome domain-containing protein [Steroidobacteraceae bacterium]
MRSRAVSIRLAALALASLLTDAAAQTTPMADFSIVQPILAERCVMCHAGEGAPLGLRLDSHAALMKGSSKGPVVKAGDPAGSELIRRIKGESQPRMPLTGPPYLSAGEIALFERWIADGARPAGQPEVASASAAPRPQPGPPTWADVAPIFSTRCARCHARQGLMGPAPESLRLTSYQDALEASERARIVPGNPDASELMRRIRGQARPRMPFDGPPFLTGSEIRLISDWIVQGARDTEGRPAAVPVGAAVRLHGRLEPGWRLDGLELGVDSATRLDKGPRPGDYVEIRGTIEADGAIAAYRIRPR